MPLPIKCKICPVSSVSDFIKQIEGLRSSSCLFRGEADFYEYNFMRAKALRSYSNTYDNPRPIDPFFLKMKDFGRYVKHRLTENEQNDFVILFRQLQKAKLLATKYTKQLQDYKDALIAAVVTGQVDVRNIAVEAVPPEDLAPSDDPDESEEQDSPVSEESEE